MTDRKINPRGSKGRSARSKAENMDDEAISAAKAARGAGRVAGSAATVNEHTVVAGDTLSKIAQKYYGSGERDEWMAIYEANKKVIGDNPSLIRVGQVLKIPKRT
jgi:nucleoid-associated protein YgaU